MYRDLIILGSGGHAISVANVALSCSWRVSFLVIDGHDFNELPGTHRILDSEIDVGGELCFAIGVGDNTIRESMYLNIKHTYNNATFPSLIHPTSLVSSWVTIDEGSILMPGSIVGPYSQLGKFCILNTASSVDHNSVMEDFSSLGPHACAGGGFSLGIKSAIGINASIKHNVTIGRNVVVGANSFVKDNLPDNSLVYGVPAKIARNRKDGEPYL